MGDIPRPPGEMFSASDKPIVIDFSKADLPIFDDSPANAKDGKPDESKESKSSERLGQQLQQAQPLQQPPQQQQEAPAPKAGSQKQEEGSFDLPDFIDEEMPAFEDERKKEKAVIKAPTTPTMQRAAYPEPQKKADYPDTKFIGLRKCYRVKEGINDLKLSVRNLEDKMAEHHTTEKSERYSTLSTTLNVVQDKLILIDNKLFEQTDTVAIEVKP
jgi:hypothetical protein